MQKKGQFREKVTRERVSFFFIFVFVFIIFVFVFCFCFLLLFHNPLTDCFVGCLQQIENGTYVKKKKDKESSRSKLKEKGGSGGELKTINGKFVNGILYVNKKKMV
jgi:hypothetical protein